MFAEAEDRMISLLLIFDPFRLTRPTMRDDRAVEARR
jgi:hypothetical protein